ncbi:MAG: hypothetical protein ACK56C_10260 [Alphaproteobacteria bacterium]
MTPASSDLWQAAHALVASSRELGPVELEAGEVIRRLSEAGFKASKTSLASARRAQLIPRSRTPGLGRGRGKVSYYPAITVGIYACYQAALKTHRNRGEAAWRLWCMGADVPEKYWRPKLERAARQIDFVRSLARFIAKRQIGTDRQADYAARRLDRLAATLFEAPTSQSMFRRVRKDLGPDRLREFLGHLVAILAGRFEGFTTKLGDNDPDRIQDSRLMDAVFAMQTARTDHAPGGKPWLSGDVSPILAKLSAGIGRQSAVAVLARSSNSLAPARSELGNLIWASNTMAQLARNAFGDHAYGLRRVREFTTSLTPALEAATLVLWLMIRSEFAGQAEQFKSGIEKAISDAPKSAVTPLKLKRKSNPYSTE